MANAQTQGWDVVVELNESALSRQLNQWLTQAATTRGGSTLQQRMIDGVSVGLNEVRLSFIPGLPQDLRITLTFSLNGSDFIYQAQGRIRALTRNDSELIVLDLERPMLSFDEQANGALGVSDLAERLRMAGLSQARIASREFLVSLEESFLNALQNLSGGSGAVLPLSGPVPAALFHLDARVVTEPVPPHRRAFTLFIRAVTTVALPPDGGGPVHIAGPGDQSAIVVRNNFLIGTLLCPALNSARIFMPPPMFSFTPATGTCSSSTATRIVGAPTMFLITGIALTVNAAGRIALTGTFSLVEPVSWGSGTFTVTVGLRWNSEMQRLEADGPPIVAVDFEIAGWVYIIGALLLATVGGVAGVASGGIGAIIGAIVGAAAGIALTYTLQEITRQVIQGTLGQLRFPSASLPLPLLVPTALRTQTVRLDDLVILARPEIAGVAILGDLREIDRRQVEVLPASGDEKPGDVALGLLYRYNISYRGEFSTATTHLRPPIRFIWSLNGSRLEGEGSVSLARGTLHYRAEGARLILASTLGSWLNEHLYVEAVDVDGARFLARRLLRASGDRISIPRDPLLVAAENTELLAAGRVGPIPEPLGDPWALFISDPDFIRGQRSIDAEAVARGMGMNPAQVRMLVEL